MQRLVDRIYREFAANGKYLEINALDGNGDSFRVYQGEVERLIVQNFMHVLREPLCFYFFNATCIVDGFDDDDTIIRRDLCWLTDPLPPRLDQPLPHGFNISWDPVKFCGVNAPSMLESVNYTIEIAEGVEWKEGMISRYMNDTTATSYRPIFKGKNIQSTTLQHLKPATWYHARIVVDYLGLQVMSESITMHTLKAEPSSPGVPKITLVPITDPFDTKNVLPSRYEIMVSWTPSQHNGCPIEKYQVHLKRFDLNGHLILHEPNLKVKRKDRPENTQRTISVLLGGNKANNQWIQSPGKSEVQIRHSLKTRKREDKRVGTEAGIAMPSSTGSRPNSRSNSPGPVEAFGLGPGHGPGHGPGEECDPAGSGVGSGNHAWKIIYDKLPRSTKLYSPGAGAEDGEWWLRVRARNAEGWSDFSSVTVISHAHYPSLFAEPMKVYIPRPLDQGAGERAGAGDMSGGHYVGSGNGAPGSGLSSPGTSGKSTYSSTYSTGGLLSEGLFSSHSSSGDGPAGLLHMATHTHADAERPVTRLNRQYGSINTPDLTGNRTGINTGNTNTNTGNVNTRHPFANTYNNTSGYDDMTMTTISTNTNTNNNNNNNSNSNSNMTNMTFDRRQSNTVRGGAVVAQGNHMNSNSHGTFLPEIRKR